MGPEKIVNLLNASSDRELTAFCDIHASLGQLLS